MCSTSRASATTALSLRAGRVAAAINMGVTGADSIIKIVDVWTVRDGKVTSIWVAYFEPQALLDKLGIAHQLAR
jgi:hypothetical protein